MKHLQLPLYEETWLKYPSIQDNIKFLREGLSNEGMLDQNPKGNVNENIARTS